MNFFYPQGKKIDFKGFVDNDDNDDGDDSSKSDAKDLTTRPSSRCKWSPSDKEELVRLCKPILLNKGTQITKFNVEKYLKGSFLLKKFNFSQIRTKLSYLRN